MHKEADEMGIVFGGIQQVSRFFDYMTIDEDEDVVKIMSSSIEEIQGKPTKLPGHAFRTIFCILNTVRQKHIIWHHRRFQRVRRGSPAGRVYNM